MGRKTEKEKGCRVASVGRRPCFGEIEPVNLNLKSDNESFPKAIRLCVHHKRELMELGVFQFFDRYPMGMKQDPSKWIEPELLADRQMSYLAPEALEGVSNSLFSPSFSPGGYGTVPGYEDLREVRINLEEIALTDKQLTAVSLVYYGGVKKNRAAKVMKISAQALADHVKAALKKIKAEICRM